MPPTARFTRPLVPNPFIRGLLVAVALSCVLAASSAQARQDGKSGSEQADAKQKLADIQAKMNALAKQQADTAARRDSANAELAKQAAALATAARAVHQTDTELAAKQKQLDDLQQQQAALKQSLDSQHAAIGELLRATYALGQGSDLRLLLGDEDVAQISRALMYSKYFQQDRVQRVQQLMADLAKLQELQTAITAEQQSLEATRDQRRQQAKALAQRRLVQVLPGQVGEMGVPVQHRPGCAEAGIGDFLARLHEELVHHRL